MLYTKKYLAVTAVTLLMIGFGSAQEDRLQEPNIFDRSFNVLSTNSQCPQSGYTKCQSYGGEVNGAQLEILVKAKTPEILGKEQGVNHVAPGTSIQYACGEWGEDDGVQHNTYLVKSQDVSTQNFGKFGEGITPEYIIDSEAYPKHRELENQGKVSVSFSEPTNVAIACTGASYNEENRGAGWVQIVKWSNQFVKAQDGDGDEIYDVNDQCPQEGDLGFGLKDNGCPILDDDGDGVGNNVDQCPGTGNPELGVNDQGCAIQDNDQDGVTDSVDQCPQTYGSKTTGCPTVFDKIINVLGLRGVI